MIPRGERPVKSNSQKPKGQRLICLCNAVTQEEIENAIRGGCHSLGRIFDTTTAGVGACGGTCQPNLRMMLESYLRDGTFPENPRPIPRPIDKRPPGEEN